jgi:UDP-N-acetylmuramyl pentapeptide phosphotransferase/UDP-N-acetylglucosamine-1-phosphate transferase
MPELTTLISALVVPALASLAACTLLVLTQRWHGALSLDRELTGKQKFHKVPVPRIGGVAMVLGTVSAFAWLHLRCAPGLADEVAVGVAALIGSAAPVFAVGLAEDVTKRVSVRMRFALVLASALLACWSLDAVLPPVGLPLADDLLAFMPLAVCATAIGVIGVTNSINIIDGFNGLAGSTAIAILAGMAWLAWGRDDMLVLELALLGIGTTIGFLLVNYPRGLLFMGDGGAYFLGFWCAECAVLLVCRNPSISPWQVLALHAYPVTEVLYSIFRKKVLRGMSATMPDRLHLHMLIFRRCVCRWLPRDARRPWVRNAAVAWLVAPWMTAWTIAVVALGASAWVGALLLCLHTVVYVAIYVRLLRGRWQLPRAAMFKRRGRVLRAPPACPPAGSQ